MSLYKQALEREKHKDFVGMRKHDHVHNLVINKEYCELLAKQLMLDELLCGECDPVEFLQESMLIAQKNQKIEYHERKAREHREGL